MSLQETMEDVQARQKKEIKALEGEKRSAIKKAKSTGGKGKKAKEMMASVEAEYDEKVKQMQARHAKELEDCAATNGGESAVASSGADDAMEKLEISEAEKGGGENDDDGGGRDKKLEKARKKRERQRQKEKDRQRAIEEETANAGPSPREIETNQILQVLNPLDLTIREIPADGHCLYRAVAASVGSLPGSSSPASYQEIREACAKSLEDNADEFFPFCEYDADVPDFQSYVRRVRNSSEWGGHVELRALSAALRRPVHVYSAQSHQQQPLVIENQNSDAQQQGGGEPILLSYHLHYYSLGEHYNQVVPK